MVYEQKAEDWGMSLHYDVCLQKIKLKNNFLDFYDVSLVKFVILFSCVCLSQERARRDSTAEAGVHGPDASESLSHRPVTLSDMQDVKMQFWKEVGCFRIGLAEKAEVESNMNRFGPRLPSSKPD